MAIHEVGKREVGAHENTLVAATVDEVRFADDLDAVEVVSDGAAAIYFTVDGSTPTVGGSNCFYLPAVASAREVSAHRTDNTTVKLISAGTPTYSVARVSE